MNFGFGGLSEIALIFMIILLLFGSKEVPHLFKQAARMFAKVKVYTDKIKNQLDEVIKSDQAKTFYESESVKRKDPIRDRYKTARDALTLDARKEKSEAIARLLYETPQYKDARAIMIYASIGAEVETRHMIAEMLKTGKRVVLPFCKENPQELGIGEIADFEKDTVPGVFGIPEPVERVRGNFFKSDLGLILCPAVAFDIYGARLGHGKGYYDMFLKEVRGRIPLFGLAFDCQIHQQNLPFDYHDVPMDQVITENGLLLSKEA